MHARCLGWLPTDCTAELRIDVHFYAPIQRRTLGTHWFYFVNNTHVFDFFLIGIYFFAIVDGKAGGPLLS